MTWYDEEFNKLAREVDPWVIFDTEKEELVLRPDTPAEIVEKDKQARAIYNSLPKSWRF